METNRSDPTGWAHQAIHGNESTWVARLLLNLLSYTLILGPVAFIVASTKLKLLPTSFRSNSIVRRFVHGSEQDTILKDEDKDSERLLANGKIRPQRPNAESKTQATVTFIWCLLGLQISYLIWGVLQEKIMTTKYTPTNRLAESLNLIEGTKQSETKSDNTHNQTSPISPDIITFHDSQFLVFLNRIIAFILSIIALVYNRPKQSKLYALSNYPLENKPSAPLYEYVYCSLTNILSSWCQYEALKYVNFPTQVLSKSCKIVPVMLMSKVMLRKRYEYLDYFCALLLSAGMFIFLVYQPPSALDQKRHASTTMSSDINRVAKLGSHLSEHIRTSTMFSGLVILALYLAFDSFTSNWQQSLYSRYSITNWQMMAATNFYSIVLTVTSLHQLGNLKPAFKMLAASSPLLIDCLLMSVMSSIGQLFIFYTIKRFGSVIFAVIMTLRQFLAILLSCAIYGHQLSAGSAMGLVLVFLVVGYQMWRKSGAKSASGPGGAKAETGVRIQFKALAK